MTGGADTVDSATNVTEGDRLAARPLLTRVLSILATLALLTLMGHVVLNVIMRYFFRAPLYGTFEIVGSWYLPIIALAGFVWAKIRKVHIETEVIYALLPGRSQREMDLIAHGIGFALCLAFTVYTAIEAAHGVRINAMAGASQVPVWPVKLAVPVSFGTLTVLFALDVVRGIPAVRGLPTVRGDWIFRIAGGLMLAVILAVMFGSDDKVMIATGCLGLLLMLLFLKVPVAFSLAIPGLLGLWLIRPRALYSELRHAPFEATANWSLSVIPMFVFMGLLLWKSGLTTRIYQAAREWLYWLPAGLAVSTTAAGTGLAAVSGSTIGTTYALSRIGMPEMLRAGYDRRMAVGAVMVAGLPGQLIPPSTLLVVYAGIAEVPIGPQLIAGIIPGLMVSGVFIVAMIAMALAMPGLVGTERVKSSLSLNARLRLLGATWPVPALIVVILGGMYSGVMTATEVGGVGALGAVLLTLFTQRGRAWDAISAAALETIAATGAIFMVLIGAEVLTDLLALSGLTRGFTTWVGSVEIDRLTLLFCLFGAYLIMGTFLEPLPIMLLTVPLLLPVIEGMGISPLWFGVFVVFMAELAMLSPPVGILAFIVHGIVKDPEVNLGQDITLRDVFVAVGWFTPIAIMAGILLILFPEMATWLPGQM